ncbi:MAG: class I SAM-dependent methyltransferase [Deltaproteobacteria bacterium]|nr:class I SAM-dependent methyltransferase [Deltaproteobacteria bacterium]
MTDFKLRGTNYDIEWQVEKYHWWFSVRRKIIGDLLTSINISKKEWAIDIGCGVGSNLNVLSSKGIHSIGLDHSLYALTLVKKRLELPLINGNLNKLPLRSNSISLIVAMDVLEHLDNDVNGISELYRVLKKGGKLILTVPAFGFLRGIQDKVTGHKRRYLMMDITEKLRHEGFNIIRSSYFNFFLFFPIFLMRRMINLFGLKIESENKINHPLINFILKAIFSLEPYFLKYISFPFGVSILCVGRKD